MNEGTIMKAIDVYVKDGNGNPSRTQFYGFYINLDDKTMLALLAAMQRSNASVKTEVAAKIGGVYYELTFAELRKAMEPFRK